MDHPLKDLPRKGRGAVSNRAGRFEAHRHQKIDDGWPGDDEPLPPLRTMLGIDTARRVITRNNSPDIPFDRSINAYRGCEHGCVYCFARPTHAYYGLSPGLDFETRLFYKPDAAEILEKELKELERRYRREPVPRPDYWGGYRVVPDRIEFWQGRPGRLHDRIEYDLQPDGDWSRRRLAP